MDDAEELARWLHAAANRVCDWPKTVEWEDILESSRANYLAVARELLERPPDVLQAALCRPDAVAREPARFVRGGA